MMPLPPLALHKAEWEKIGMKMGWLKPPSTLYYVANLGEWEIVEAGSEKEARTKSKLPRITVVRPATSNEIALNLMRG